ncbi:polysaccharide pyruvyl transferase CsaB [Salsuginibacillus kocurii]|uniref:polysaccharide pyruvyl transferase CsaB n=1 Tax=Salsuginibacillus kocurii TaxID=427078 RepID=UPI000360E541|nr:polysaccharide pyruvyl transferase CsaB [Salsuginibacillus kocurii]
MHVVLSGFFGFQNVGDEAILKAVIASLRKEKQDIEITVLSNDPEETKQTHGVHAVNRWSGKEIIRAIRRADGVISGGGSLLQDKTGPRSVVYYTAIMNFARFFRKPYVVYAQGIGPIERKWARRTAAHALKRSALLTVRDEGSHQFIKELGVNKPIEVVPDPVLALDGTSQSCPWLDEQEFDKPILAVSVRPWDSSTSYQDALSALLDHEARRGYQIAFLPMHTGEDEEASALVQAKMEEEAVIVPSTLGIEEKIGFIARSAFLIGMRLHALIFAAIGRTPFLALSYDPKIDAFIDMAEQPLLGHVEDKLEADELITTVDHFVKEKTVYKEKLERYVEQAQQEVDQTSKKAIDVFTK